MRSVPLFRHAPTEQDASSSAAPILTRPGKRRASRWGVSQVNVATTSDATTSDAEKVVVTGTDAPAAVGGDSEMVRFKLGWYLHGELAFESLHQPKTKTSSIDDAFGRHLLSLSNRG